MRVNKENKSVDMEARDINYILPAYVRSYLFYNQNELPEKIIFPMFPSVKAGGKDIPIEYVPPMDEIATEIAEDGKDIAEITEEEVAVLDEKDEEIKRLKAEVEALTANGRREEGRGSGEDLGFEDSTTTPEEAARGAKEQGIDADYEAAKADQPESPARAAFAGAEEGKPEPATELPPDRIPKQPPGGDIGPGVGPSDMQPRQRGDQTRTQRDLIDEPEIDEKEEKEFDQTVSRSDKGEPVVEDKPNDSGG